MTQYVACEHCKDCLRIEQLVNDVLPFASEEARKQFEEIQRSACRQMVPADHLAGDRIIL